MTKGLNSRWQFYEEVFTVPRDASVTAPDGQKIAYDVSGEGSPLVLLPGLMMTRERWHAVGYTGRLAAKRCVIALDPLGHGDSDKPYETDAYGLGALADHTAAVLDAEGVDKADVWGYSRGCLLLVALMQFYPGRITSGVAGGVDLTQLGGDPLGSGDSSYGDYVGALREKDWASFWQSYPTKVPRSVQEYMEDVNDPLAVAALIEARYEIDVDPSKFRGMVYVGDGEPFAKGTADIAPLLNLHCVVLPTGGHAETFTAMDVVCDAVEPFLDGSVGPG